MKKALSLFVTTFLVAVSVQAQLGSTPPQSGGAEVLELRATAAGAELDASGTVRIDKVFDGTVSVTVRSNASLPDGSILVVAVIAETGEADIGAIELSLGSGILRLNSRTQPESAAFPIEEVGAFLVFDDGELLLFARR